MAIAKRPGGIVPGASAVPAQLRVVGLDRAVAEYRNIGTHRQVLLLPSRRRAIVVILVLVGAKETLTTLKSYEPSRAHSLILSWLETVVTGWW